MKISTRIFFCYLIISAFCFYYPFNWILDSMRTRYLEGVEDPLVDQANTLATIVGLEMQRQDFSPERWAHIFAETRNKEIHAQIYKLLKKHVDTVVYITDSRGMVLFNSEHPAEVGKDYSKWRDVHLTLQGFYGARTSQADRYDEASSVLYVAAPILVNKAIAGVLTVGKPTTNITWFVKNAKMRIIGVAAVALMVAGFFSFLVSLWLTRPIKRLTDYAYSLSNGRQPAFPRLGTGEIATMGQAFETMREALEGKRYVEQYIQNLTHEIKSPLSAIRGSAELLAEPMEEAQRQRFLSNINSESQRIQKIIDRMLELSSLESRKKLLNFEKVDIRGLVRTVRESLEPVYARKQIQVSITIPDKVIVHGDPFLLHQALANIVQNAIDFSPVGGRIEIVVELREHNLRFVVSDEGPGIEEYALNRVFDKFFSLQRPDTGMKSTGLGLNFVRQVALLHGGMVSLENIPGKGCRASLQIPRNFKS